MTLSITLMFFVVVATSFTPGLGSMCDIGYKFHKDALTCFKLRKSSENFKNANYTCNSYKTNLAKVSDEQTNRFLQDMLSPNEEAWIGLNDLTPLNNFQWTDGTTLGTFSDWADDQSLKDNIPSGVIITKQGWKKTNPIAEKSFFCQSAAGKPQFCESKQNKSYGVELYKASTVRICILTLDDPSQMSLYKYKFDRSWERVEESFIGFERIDGFIGYIDINITRMKKMDDYEVYVENSVGYTYLKINLTSPGRPKCPFLFKAKQVEMSHVLLEWVAGHNGGSPQNFTVQDQNNKHIQQHIVRQERGIFEAHITGLKEGTTYTFVLEAENVHGKAQDCNNVLNVTTESVAPSKPTGQSTNNVHQHQSTSQLHIASSEPTITEHVAVKPMVKITTTSTVPSKEPTSKSPTPNREDSAENIIPQNPTDSDAKETDLSKDRTVLTSSTTSKSEQAQYRGVQDENNNDLIVIIVPASICVVLALVVTLVIVVLVLRRKTASRNIQDKGEPTYAVVQDVETKRDYIGTNIDETYAVVNKKQKANKKDVGAQDFNPLDETYAAVNKNKKTNKGDTVASTDPVSNPMAQPKGMNFNMAALKEEADVLPVYKKVQKEHGEFSTEDKTQTNSTEGSGRYLNEDGLVYVTVELNPVAPKSTIKPPSIVRDERYEPVEYSTIVPGQGAKKDETNDEA